MKKFRWLMAGGMVALAGVANAEVSATVTAASDYDFRGYSQTAKDPAIQASVDYAHDILDLISIHLTDEHARAAVRCQVVRLINRSAETALRRLRVWQRHDDGRNLPRRIEQSGNGSIPSI